MVKTVTEKGVSFSTGAVRSKDAEGARFDLVSPIGLRRVAETCREGADKYGDYNWEKGMPINDLLNHALQHIYNYLSGDRSEDHLGHAGWGLMAAMHSEEMWPYLNENLRGPGCVPPQKIDESWDKLSKSESAVPLLNGHN